MTIASFELVIEGTPDQVWAELSGLVRDSSKLHMRAVVTLTGAAAKSMNPVLKAFKHAFGMTDDAPAITCLIRVRQAIEIGSKIGAIKEVRDFACCGLKEAKEFVERYCETDGSVTPDLLRLGEASARSTALASEL